MNDIITIPAGVIQPKDLLMWLRKRRDDARQVALEYQLQEDEIEAAESMGFAQAYDDVIQHIQYGGAS